MQVWFMGLNKQNMILELFLHLLYITLIEAMRRHAQGSIPSRVSARHPPNRNSPIRRPQQQGGKFFELDYLFAEPNINRFHRNQNRAKHRHYLASHSNTIDLTTIEGPDYLERSRVNTFAFKEIQKTGEEGGAEQLLGLQIGERGEAIHSKRCECRIRTLSSLNDNRASEVTLRRQLKKTTREHSSEASRVTIAPQHHNYPLISINAQGVSYSLRSNQHRHIHSAYSSQKRTTLVPKTGGGSSKQNGKGRGSRQGRGYRPWSPEHYQDGLQVMHETLIC